MQRITHPVLRWNVALCGLLTWGAILLVGGPVRAELYSLTDLGTLGGTQSYAYGINTAGQVVGWATNIDNVYQHAFVYSNGTMTDLGTFGGPSSAATGINTAGQVVGWAQTIGPKPRTRLCTATAR
jgi:probable HAF family extracellular repeat protein